MRLDVEHTFDGIFVFDAIHDQADPWGVPERLRRAESLRLV
jgi:hypothetical protein